MQQQEMHDHHHHHHGHCLQKSPKPECFGPFFMPEMHVPYFHHSPWEYSFWIWVVGGIEVPLPCLKEMALHKLKDIIQNCLKHQSLNTMFTKMSKKVSQMRMC